jgi:hypothetical protein
MITSGYTATARHCALIAYIAARAIALSCAAFLMLGENVSTITMAHLRGLL